MPLPIEVTKSLLEWKERGFPVGFYPWPEGDVMLWGFIDSISAKHIRFKLIGTRGEFDSVKSYPISRIWKFNFDPVYATRLLELSKREWRKEKERLAVSSKERDIALQAAFESGNPIYVKVTGDGKRAFVVKGIFETWVLLGILDELNRDSDSNEADFVLKSKLKVYVESDAEPNIHLRRLALENGTK